MSHTKGITFEGNEESLAPFITNTNNIEMAANGKLNYSAMRKTEEFHPESNYSTVSSTNTAYQKDTAVLLHARHQDIYEEAVHRRSLKATICMIFAMLLILALIGIAIASLHHKLTNQNTEQGMLQNKTTLPEPEGTNLFFNVNDDLVKHNSTLFHKHI